MEYLYVTLLALGALALVQVNALLAFRVWDARRSWAKQRTSDRTTRIGSRSAARGLHAAS